MNTKIKKLSYIIRQTLFLTGAAGSLLVASAYAQEVQEVTVDKDIEVIGITGQRLANARAIDTKREAHQVVDALASDDIGALPDFNIGEAIQRLPGITIKNDQAEARFISIRALNPAYNYMTIDGMSMAVPDRNGRRPYMDTLPSSMVKSIEVYKTLTPDMEGTGIGGQINLVSRSAFDFDDMFFKVSGEVGQYENADGYESDGNLSGQGNFVFANTFGESEEFGLVVTGNYYKRDSYVLDNQLGSNRKWIDPSDNSSKSAYAEGTREVNEQTLAWYHNNRQRTGGSAKFEYRPTEGSQYYINAFYNSAKDDEARQTDKIGWASDFNSTSETEGTYRARHRNYLGLFDFERNVWGTAVGANFNFDDGSFLEVSVNNSGSKFRNPEYWYRFQQGTAGSDEFPSDKIDVAYEELGGGDSRFALSGVDFSQNLDWGVGSLDDRGLDEEINEAKIDYGFNTDSFAEGWGYKVGAKFRNTDREFNESVEQNYSDGNYTLANVDADGGVSQMQTRYRDQGMYIIDTDIVKSSFENHLAANPELWRTQVKENEQFRRDYTLSEDIKAAYIMATYAGENFHAIFGVRYEGTSWDGTGFTENKSATSTWNVSTATVNDAPTARWETVSNSGGYDDILPSVNLSYDINDDVKVHFAYTEAIGRVDYNLIAPVGEAIDYVGNDEYDITISRSNPDLEARRSNNLDLSVEWYLDEGQGILAAGLFHKVLSGEVFKTTEEVMIPNEAGASTLALASQYINADEDINIHGLELNFVKNLDMLPGLLSNLGFSANSTWTYSDFDIATEETAAKSGYYNEKNLLVGQSEKTFNSALFYQDDMFSARIAYNYTGWTLSSINLGSPYRSKYEAPRGKVDVQATYHATENLDLSVNIWNLTDSASKKYIGRDQELLRQNAVYGKAIFFGFTYKM